MERLSPLTRSFRNTQLSITSLFNHRTSSTSLPIDVKKFLCQDFISQSRVSHISPFIFYWQTQGHMLQVMPDNGAQQCAPKKGTMDFYRYSFLQKKKKGNSYVLFCTSLLISLLSLPYAKHCASSWMEN